MNDREILDLLWQRTEAAIDALQRAYGRLLYRIAMNILGMPQDAQECVNDCYLAVWNAIPPKRPEPLSPFVCRIGRNLALKRRRADSAQRRCSKYDLSLEELSDSIPGASLGETVTARALGRAIDDFLSRQAPENRRLFIRRYWFGDSVKETAALLGIRENTASVRLSRMRKDLKEYLIREELYYE